MNALQRLAAGTLSAGFLAAATIAPANAAAGSWWWHQPKQEKPAPSSSAVPTNWPVDPRTLEPVGEPLLTQNSAVEAEATLKSLGQTVKITGGSFTGDAVGTSTPLPSGAGNWFMVNNAALTLPPASTQIKLGSLPLADAKFKMDTTSLSAAIDVNTVLTDPTSTGFYAVAAVQVQLPEVRLSFLPWWNLTGDQCRTKEDVVQTLAGPYSLDPSVTNTFSSEFELGEFRDCGFITPIFNLIAPGGGNTFTAKFLPATPPS